MQATLIGWEVFAITRDPFSIGLIGLVEFVPAVAMAIYSGYIIDRTDKKKLLHLSIAGNLVLTVFLPTSPVNMHWKHSTVPLC